MQKGLDPTQTTTCMKCRKAPSRYHGTWGEEGLCRPCILAMEPTVRRRVLRELHPAERKRWQLDELAERARDKERDAGKQRPPAGKPAATAAATSPPSSQAFHPREDTASKPGKRFDRHERREQPREFAELPVRFSVVATGEHTPAQLRGRSFRSVTKDLSEAGLSILIRDRALFEVPAGCGLRLEISVPPDNTVVRCPAVVRNVVRTGRGQDAGHLCVQFERPQRDGAELQRLLQVRRQSRLIR